jgi:hypothetical protein
MSLAELIRGNRATNKFATATPATLATRTAEKGRTVATVATVAVANANCSHPSPAELVELRRLYDVLAERWQWTMPKTWEGDEPTMMSDYRNALTCLRNLVAELPVEHLKGRESP